MENNKIKHWQCEIIAADELLDEDGNLKHIGFSKKMFLKYNRRRIGAKPCRIKEWDYYLIYNDDVAVALTFDDNAYMGMFSASVVDLKAKQETTKSKIIWFPMGKLGLPASSTTGDCAYEKNGLKVEFRIAEKSRRLKFIYPKFKDKKTLDVDITLTAEPSESMVIVTPFNKPKHFYYNQKIVGFKASGQAKLNDEVVAEFNAGNSRALLDWGRGVWTYKNTWYWGAACGNVNGHEVGFNIGYGFGDTRGATENMIFYDGKAHKLEHISIEIPQENGKMEYLKPWKVTSSDGRFECEFVPTIDRASNTNIIIIGSNQHQVFGKFNGIIVLDNGEKVKLKNFTGFIEKVVNKW